MLKKKNQIENLEYVVKICWRQLLSPTNLTCFVILSKDLSSFWGPCHARQTQHFMPARMCMRGQKHDLPKLAFPKKLQIKIAPATTFTDRNNLGWISCHKSTEKNVWRTHAWHRIVSQFLWIEITTLDKFPEFVLWQTRIREFTRMSSSWKQLARWVMKLRSFLS